MHSPLTDPKPSTALQGKAGPRHIRKPDNAPGNGQGAPAATPVDFAMKTMGKGTAGRKTFPNLGM